MSEQRAASKSPPPAKRARLEQRQIKCVPDLYLEAKFADVWFSFGSDDGTTKRIPAHKLLLAIISDVFEAMFFGGLKETGDVVITDASAEEFKEFLQFFYQRDAKLTTEHVAAVMNLGQKYNVGKCVDACVEHLQRNLTDENVCAALTLAILYDRDELTSVCEKQIQSNTALVFAYSGFLECSKEVLAYILQMNSFSCSEIDVFEACMSWVKAKSQQNTVSKATVQEYLGDLYYEIRYGSMTIQEFCTLEEKYSDVLHDDFHAITRLIAKTGKQPARFSSSLRQIEYQRQIMWNKQAIIECNCDGLDYVRRYKLNAEEKIVFSTNQPLLLGNFKCNWIIHDENNMDELLPIEVQIIEAVTLDGGNAKFLSKMTVDFQSAYTIVSLPQSLLIRPDYFYTIYIKGFPENHYFCSSEQQNSMNFKSGIKIDFHNCKVINGKIGGLIWQMNFNKI